jgi:hypothetical protein
MWGDLHALSPSTKRKLLARPNVNGVGVGLKPRRVDGKEYPDELVHRVYVQQKVEASSLSADQLIPEKINGIDTDVVNLGPVKALDVDRTSKIRPIPPGVSIGHWMITAGTSGALFRKNGAGELLMGTNAHVGCPSPFLALQDVLDKRILQPGAHHAGQVPSNVCGSYVYHQPLKPYGSDKWNFLNWFGFNMWRLCMVIKQIAGRQVSANGSAVVTAENLIDFACFKKDGADFSADSMDGYCNKEPIVGLLFAGSTTAGIICKIEHIAKTGYIPVDPMGKVSIGTKIKGSSYWGDYCDSVMDDSAEILTAYGDYYSMLSDVIIMNSAGVIKGGWSGSAFRLAS